MDPYLYEGQDEASREACVDDAESLEAPESTNQGDEEGSDFPIEGGGKSE